MQLSNFYREGEGGRKQTGMESPSIEKMKGKKKSK